MSKIEIDDVKCKGCGLCSITCRNDLIALSGKINDHGYTPATFDSSKATCTACSLCAEICPDLAIKVFK